MKRFLILAILMIMAFVPVSSTVFVLDYVGDAYKNVSAEENDIAFVGETNTSYRFSESDAGYTPNGTSVLWTGQGGDTRWIAISGNYIADNLTVDGVLQSLSLGTYATLDTIATTVLDTASAWRPLVGEFTFSPNEGFRSLSDSTLFVGYTGSETLYFCVDWHACMAGNSNGITAAIALEVNGVVDSTSAMCTFLKTASESQHLSGSYVSELSADGTIRCMVNADDADDEITVNNVTLTITKFY